MMEPTTLPMDWLNEVLDVDIRRRVSYQIHEPIMTEVFRPSMSERNPEHKAATNDPPAIEAVMPP